MALKTRALSTAAVVALTPQAALAAAAAADTAAATAAPLTASALQRRRKSCSNTGHKPGRANSSRFDANSTSPVQPIPLPLGKLAECACTPVLVVADLAEEHILIIYGEQLGVQGLLGKPMP